MKKILLLFFLLFFQECFAAKSTFSYEINGVSGSLLNNVQTRLQKLTELNGQSLNAASAKEIYREAPQEIKKALEPFGYFHATVNSQLLTKQEGWKGIFTIHLSEPLRIEQLDLQIKGEGKNALRNLIMHFPLKKGAIFQTQSYLDAKDQWFAAAHQQGFIKAYFEKNAVLVDLKKNRVGIILYFQTGPQYFFGPVTFQNNQYSPAFLQRFPIFPQGPFASEKLTLWQQDLTGSYYFQHVNVIPQFDKAENFRVPIRIEALAPKSQRYTLGIGYGTFTGPRLTTTASFRRVTSTGHHFDAQLKISSVLSAVTGKYYIPGKNPLTDQWITGLSYQRFLPKNGSSSSSSIFAGYTKKYQYWQSTVNLNYLFEQFKVKKMSAETSSLLYPSFNLSYTRTNDLLNPTSGLFFNVMLQGSQAFSSTRFLQTELKGKYLWSPTAQDHILLRGNLGYTTVANISNLPLSMRFFAGGPNSIRGYQDSSIGPGRYLEVFSAEYQHRITGNWSGAIFYDAGNASDHYDDKFTVGRGVGIVYHSMIGPIKLYVAQAVSKPNKPLGIEFSIGPEF